MIFPKWYENRIQVNEFNEHIHENTKVCFAGFLRRIRKLGSLCFVNLVDGTGDIQLVFTESKLESILSIPKESVITVYGVIKKRKDVNQYQKMGQWEVIVEDLFLINKAELLPPFNIDQNIQANEDTKLTYRYLDLRGQTGDNIRNRSKIINLFRTFLLSKNFIEVETPTLGRSTPEGARDYLVPVRNKNHATGFALPQSPQLYKQLLMIGGLEQYFQIARNYRDEDLRADRQPEFSQLDLEVAFSNTNKLMSLLEEMFVDVWKNFFNLKLNTPFRKLTYKECMNSYGTDKPDLRFGLKILDKTADFLNSDLKIFESVRTDNHKVKIIFAPNQFLDKKNHKNLENIAKDFGLKGVLYGVKNYALKEGTLFKFVANWTEKYFQEISSIGTVILVSGEEAKVLSYLGLIRNKLGKMFNLIDESQYEFLWVIDWPLFEFDKTENKWTFAHHPFTSPQDAFIETFDQDPANAQAESYDLVLNGLELGSGSKRIYDSQIQTRMFNAIGLNSEEIATKFGWFIKAFQFGTPPHQGIGLGLDRILQLMLKTNTIRDVIAFPKNNQGFDMLTNAPDEFSDEQLKILNLENIKRG